MALLQTRGKHRFKPRHLEVSLDLYFWRTYSKPKNRAKWKKKDNNLWFFALYFFRTLGYVFLIVNFLYIVRFAVLSLNYFFVFTDIYILNSVKVMKFVLYYIISKNLSNIIILSWIIQTKKWLRMWIIWHSSQIV